ncbi:MAG: hypothetical protein ISS70_19510 [Phycisphaerae bacterium]|nr:hypothetical protein [Phycisphaerae bacterium]
MRRTTWANDVRLHLALASVGNSTLMKQSGKGRVNRARLFLANEVPIASVSAFDKSAFSTFLDQKTIGLSRQLPRPDDGRPNWGAARKVISIFLRMCAMNKDLHTAFNLATVEPLLEVPLDNQIVAKIDQESGSHFSKNFKIKYLSPDLNSDIQGAALRLASRERIYRYELDVLYWNAATLA